MSRSCIFYGGPLEFMFIVQSTEDPAYRVVSMLPSKLKDEVHAKIIVAGISTTCSQKIHNQLHYVDIDDEFFLAINAFMFKS
ncbi:hypothetical protein DVH24_022763 [Malus domestica]|uniref:Uncharacterized protein n=1 Tax=Malus domestica TaxID=3750 RepID=A0A498KKC4_MALDO|nr:hypothetical protein DVH24_022763 [Malus domestica]